MLKNRILSLINITLRTIEKHSDLNLQKFLKILPNYRLGIFVGIKKEYKVVTEYFHVWAAAVSTRPSDDSYWQVCPGSWSCR